MCVSALFSCLQKNGRQPVSSQNSQFSLKMAVQGFHEFYRMCKNEKLQARRVSVAGFPNAFKVFQNIIKLLSNQTYLFLPKYA